MLLYLGATAPLPPTCVELPQRESQVLHKHAFLFGCRCQILCAQHSYGNCGCRALYTKFKSTFALPYDRSDEGVKSVRCFISP